MAAIAPVVQLVTSKPSDMSSNLGAVTRTGIFSHKKKKKLIKKTFPTSSCCLKKNQTTRRPSEHPPVMGGKMSKRLGGIKRLQIQNLFMAFKQVPRCR